VRASAGPRSPDLAGSSTRNSASGTGSAVTRRKPRLAVLIATAGGLGYLPKAPGTLGALVGCVVTFVSVLPWLPIGRFGKRLVPPAQSHFWLTIWPCLVPVIVIGAIGVWAASRVASDSRIKDPQYVVIDEVSGQQLGYLLGLMPLFWSGSTTSNPNFVGYGFLLAQGLLHWKYLLLGFILFRVFDIWKPFPVRQAESLPGGWGIMADDWVAGVYAAIGLWMARAAGL